MLDQVRDRCLGGVEDAGQVDVERFLPLLGRDLPGHVGRTDSGVRDDDVKSPQFVDAGRERRGQRIEVANVGLGSDNSTVQGLDQFDCLGQVVVGGAGIRGGFELSTRVDGDDVCALFCQPDSFGAPLTTGGSGDEGNFSGESTGGHAQTSD